MIIISVSVLILANLAQFNRLLPYFTPRVSLVFWYARGRCAIASS
jgi:hypothetical protein